MTLNLWIILVLLGIGSFFYSYLRLEKQKAAVMYIFSTLFLFISGISSFYLEVVTSSGVQAYTGNQIMGIILIPLALITAGFALSSLSEEAISFTR